MLEINNLTKTFRQNNEDFHALKDVSFDVKDGEIFGVIGLSGAGKSTLLRIIASLTDYESGSVIIDNVNPKTLNANQLRQFRSHIGVVFQGYNLLMQQNVFDNIAFPLYLQKKDKTFIKQKVDDIISLVGLSGKEYSYPSTLSGGQRQRVAIARALVADTKLLLLDEVTSALDPITTTQILNMLVNINQKRNVTMLLITHEMSVVSRICDRVAVLNYGVVEEIGNSKEVLTKPQKEITKLLLGQVEK